MSTRQMLRSPATWIILVVLVLEFVLFDRFGSHRVASLYPRWNDQIQYLSEAYTGYEYARAHGFAAGLWHTLVNPSAQGTLHDFAAVILFAIAGPSRSAALSLNMLALIAWQLALYFAISRRTANPWMALATSMLPLALRYPWQNIPGSAYDFRLDHFAMCAVGVAAAVAMLTDGFRHRAWSVGFGLAVGIALLARFLTGTYFLVAWLAFCGECLIGPERGRRVMNLLLAGLVAAAMAGPIFWLNREWVWNYYYIGHYVGPESAIRNQNFGLGRSLSYVFGGFARNNLGLFFAALATAVFAGLGAARWATNRRMTAETNPAPGTTAHALIVGSVFLLAPALILTLHPQKSEVVLGVLASGGVLIIGSLWQLAAGRDRGATGAATKTIAVVATLAALGYFGQRQFAPADDAATIANLRQVNTVADYVFARAEASRLEPARIAVDHITDAIDAQVLRVICYERHRVWRNFDMTLPTGIAEPDADEVRRRIYSSDFVFLTADDAGRAAFPFDRKLIAMAPELRTWCDAHLRLTRQFVLSGRPVALYERAGPAK